MGVTPATEPSAILVALVSERAGSVHIPAFAVGLWLVGVDEVFLAGGLFGIDGDLLEVQCLGEGDLLCVGAAERRFDLGCNPVPQLLGGNRPDLLKKRREQPSTDAPGHPERASELGGPAVEPTVDVHL